MKIKLKIKSWGMQNCDFNLQAILGEAAILTSISKIKPALIFSRSVIYDNTVI